MFKLPDASTADDDTLIQLTQYQKMAPNAPEISPDPYGDLSESMFTLFRVKGVITELTKAKVEGESQQVIEKFMIIEELLGQ